MRVVVTGGAGFIGSHLVARLAADGDSVTVVDDLSSGRREHVGHLGGVRLVVADLANPADHPLVAAAVEGVEVVFHLAAARAVTRSVDDPLGAHHANATASLALLEAARVAGVRRVVLASSSSVYGDAAEVPTPESAALGPRSPYAVTKLAAEQYGRVYARLHGMEVVALRLFNVYGPRQSPDGPYAQAIPRFAAALLAGRPATVNGDGLQRRDVAFVDDVVAAFVAAASAPAGVVTGRAFNVGSGTDHSVLELVDAVARSCGADPLVCHGPERPGDVWRTRADVRAAARDLGWAPRTSLETGLARTMAWLAPLVSA